VIFPLVPKLHLARFAASLARTRELKWFAGWRFGDGEFVKNEPHRLRRLLWKYYRAKRLDAPFAIPWYDDLRVIMYLGNDLSFCLYVAGTYEPNEFMFLAQMLHSGITFLDVGANDGLYTLFASRRLGPTGRIIALEPSRREFARLERNLRLNDITNALALRLAASDHEGTATLRLAGFGHEGMNSLGEIGYSYPQAASEEISLITLDSLVEKHQLARIDVIKIDVEGAELKVLQGAHAILSTHKPVILLEIFESVLKHQGASREAVLQHLESFGYRFFVFGSTGRPEPVGRVNVDGANIIAMHRDRTMTF